MDKLINKAKDVISDDKKKDESSGQSGDTKASAGSFNIPGSEDFNLRSAAETAASQAGSSGDKDLFSSITSSLTQKKGQVEKEDVDENDILSKYKSFFGSDDEKAKSGETVNETSLGAAAAMQALNLFNKGQTGGQKDAGTEGGFMALAMAEGSKLFEDKEKEGKVEKGTTKQGVIEKAGEYAMKLYVKSQMQSQGGLGKFASKFM